jgi:predicted DNA-binding ribbon-helix-helix protein
LKRAGWMGPAATSVAATATTEIADLHMRGPWSGACIAGREPHARMSHPVKRSFTIGGHRTSISLEGPFWEALKEAASRKRMPLSRLIAQIDERRGTSGLSSAVRVWLLDYYRNTPVGGDA